MIYKKRFTSHAAQLIKHLPPQIKKPLRILTDKLIEDPYLGKALHQDLRGYYSIKHNRYRIIYEIDEKHKLVIVHHLGERANIYDLFSRLVKEIKQKQ